MEAREVLIGAANLTLAITALFIARTRSSRRAEIVGWIGPAIAVVIAAFLFVV